MRSMPGEDETRQEINAGFRVPLRPEVPGYEIEDLLGSGGSGRVWRATQSGTGRAVALKVLDIESVGPEALRRAALEAEVTARLDHPAIARLFESRQQGSHWTYSMELIEGEDLAEWIERNPLSQREILTLLARICDGVQHAHQRGIIHRDLKPQNVMINLDGEPKIVDFGLAKVLSEVEATLTDQTREGVVMGTPGYMAPEQLGAEASGIDTRTDVYALGVLLYWMLLGRLPHSTEGGILTYVTRVLRDEPARPRSLQPNLPVDVEAIVVKAIARDPEERYATAGGLAADLRRYLEGEPVSARAQTFTYVVQRKLARHRARVALGIALLVGFLAAGAAVHVQLRRERDAALRARASEQQHRLAAESSAREAQRQVSLLLADRSRQMLAVHAWRAADVYASAAASSSPDYPPVDPPFASASNDVSQDVRALRSLLFASRTQGVLTSLSVWPADPGRVVDAALTPEGQVVLVSKERTELTVWTEGSSAIVPLRGDAPVQSLASTPRPGTVLVVRQDGSLELVDVRDASTRPLDVPAGGIQLSWLGRTSWTPDGKELLLVDFEDRVHSWTLADGKRRTRSGRATAVAKSSRGDLARAGVGGTVEISRSAAGPRRLDGHRDAVDALAWSPDGRWLASGGVDRTLRVLQLETQRVLTEPLPMRIHALAWTADSSTLFVASDHLYVLDVESGSVVESFPRRIQDLAVQGNLVLAGEHDGAVHLLRLEGSSATWRGHSHVVVSIAASVDGATVVSGDTAGEVRVWDAARRSTVLARHPGRVAVVAVTSDGRRMASTGDDRLLRLRDLERGGETVLDLSQVRETRFEGQGLAFSPDGSLLAVGGRKHPVDLRDPSDGHVLRSLAGDLSPASSIGFSRDGRRLAATSEDCRLGVWDPEVEEPLRVWNTGHRHCVGVSVSARGEWVVTAGEDARVRIWDLETGVLGRELVGAQAWVNQAVLVDGGWVAGASDDRHVHLWDARTGRHELSIGVRTHTIALQPLAGRDLLFADADDIRRVRLDDPWWGRSGEVLLEEAVERGGLGLDGLDLEPRTKMKVGVDSE